MANVNLAQLFVNGQTSYAQTTAQVSNSSMKVSDDLNQKNNQQNFSSQLSKAKETSQTQNNSNQVASQGKTKKTTSKTDETQSAKDSKTNTKETTNGKEVKETKEPKKSQEVKTAKKGSEKPVEAEKVTDEEEVGLEEEGFEEEQGKEIIDLIATTLQLPEEKIQEVMKQMDIKPQDLFDQEVYTQFVQNLYPQENEQNLLLQNDHLKDISKLYSKLEELSDQTDYRAFVNIDVSKTQQLLSTQEVQNTNVATQTVQAAVPIEIEAPIEEVTAEVLQNAQSQIQPDSLDKFQQGEEATVQVTTDYEVSFTDMGNVLPVQMFEQTQNVNLPFKGVQQTLSNQMVQPEIMTQMIDKIDFSLLGNMKEVNMQLSPKELGTLSIRLAENNGAMIAEIKVDNEKTKNFIQNEVEQLKTALEEQGLSVDDVKVDVRQNEAQQQMAQQRSKSSKRIQEIIEAQFEEEEEELPLEAPKLSTGNNNEVDYMA